MKKILVSLAIMGIVSAVLVGGTVAFFRDTETSTGNTFTAGSIDLKIDLQCEGPNGGNCGFSLRDLDGQSFFNECDVKPGDEGEVTISWHVDENNAWARIRLADVLDYENGCTGPEAKIDNSCADPGKHDGELSQNLYFTFWMDEGSVPGWQCPGGYGNGNHWICEVDPEEGDNILNGIETILDYVSASELVDGVELSGELEGSMTYYLGMEWEIPFATGNIIQTDSLLGKIILEVVQSRNNPNPWQ